MFNPQYLNVPSHFDTIVAPITGSEPAAVAIVRVSGPEAWQIASCIFPNWPKEAESHKAVYGRLETGDDGLVLPFSEGHSYTGEETVEFSIHGSHASVQALVQLCLMQGARMAGPGEFTQRAFLNGRMDLTQAEGVRDTVEAETEAQLKQANLYRQGILNQQVGALRNEILSLLAAVEASVDFSEEIGDFETIRGQTTLRRLQRELEALLGTAAAGRILRRGFRVAIMGRPNAGKSSLLNALLGTERAIVTDTPGTTRDYVEERVELGGVMCVLTDTAGLRATSDEVEAIGVARAHEVASNADEVWYLYDASVGWAEEDDVAVSSFTPPVLVLAGKADLSPGGDKAAMAISSVTREGFGELFAHVASQVENAGERPFIQTRHQRPLEEALESLRMCLNVLEYNLPHDLLSVGLQEAAQQLGLITGETASPDILQRIFTDFCVGK